MRKLILCLLFLAVPALAQQVSPGHQAHVNNTQPTIRADFNQRVRNARVWIDGTEFTSSARTRGETVTLVPPYPLDYGVHRVQVVTDDGRRADWSFAIVQGQTGYQTPYNTNNQPHYCPNHRHSGWNNGVTDARNYGPVPGSVVTVDKPPISAAFNGPVTNLRMYVDGRDVTHEAVIGNEGISWTPRHRLDQGQHNVRVTGVSANNGQPVSGDWNFQIRHE